MIVSHKKITLYTHPLCPWAHGIHILLQHLNVEHTSITIDLSAPREPWYFAISPLGQIPALTYGDTALTESTAIITFLWDLFLPPPTPLFRAQTTIFLSLFHQFVVPPLFRVLQKPLTPAGVETAGDDIVAAVLRHIVPRLPENGGFFGGKEEMTLVEMALAGFVMRVYAYAENGILPGSVKTRLEAEERWREWAAKVRALDAVRETWFEEDSLALAKMLVAKSNARVA